MTKESCSNCKYAGIDDLLDFICVCDRSEHVADWVLNSGLCEFWEGEE